jgi:hypothetical protein
MYSVSPPRRVMKRPIAFVPSVICDSSMRSRRSGGLNIVNWPVYP